MGKSGSGSLGCPDLAQGAETAAGFSVLLLERLLQLQLELMFLLLLLVFQLIYTLAVLSASVHNPGDYTISPRDKWYSLVRGLMFRPHWKHKEWLSKREQFFWTRCSSLRTTPFPTHSQKQDLLFSFVFSCILCFICRLIVSTWCSSSLGSHGSTTVHIFSPRNCSSKWVFWSCWCSSC